MLGHILVDATELTFWANRRDAQGRLPQLIRRLILETVDRVTQISFRAQEGVQLGGWDGIAVVEDGNAFVPDGLSGWELGTDRDVKRKADDDYGKRCANPLGVNPAEAAFIFVTPRRWGAKDKWVTEKNAEGIWREVRAYDADDLEAWLELALTTHTWLSTLLGKAPDAVSDLQTFWTDWAEAARPPLTADLIIGGREEIAERIRQWLSEPPGVFALQADAREEALAFLAASLDRLPPLEQDAQFACSLVVWDAAAWRQAVTTEHALLLMPLFEGSDAAQAVRNGHHVLIPLGKEGAPSGNTVELPRLRRDAARDALLTMKLPESRVDELATLARRSLLSLRRKLALSPELQRPRWARPDEAHTILPAMLAGTWNETREGDRGVLAALADKPYEQVGRALTRWANESDPLVRRVGNTWLLVSKEDAWSLLARLLTPEDLQRFQQVALEVLGTPDPALELPPGRHWAANVLGHARSHSSLLRQGLSDTLALMGARSAVTSLADGSTGQNYANRIVHRLLTKANEDADGHLWASLSDVLPLLSEAAPEVYLDAVARGLSGDHPPLLNLFIDADRDTLFSSSPHTGLLWALENLAWQPDHLGYVALLLGKLARLDPGGRLLNRPINSLREIFLLWHPQTAAPLDQRLRVLDVLREREPEVSWGLLVRLLPQRHEIANPTHAPRWREWKPEEGGRVTYAELHQAVHKIVDRLLTDVGTDGYRWRDLIDHVDDLSRDLQEVVIERLLNVDVTALNEKEGAAVRDTLREVVSRHRQYPGTDWAMQKEQVDRLAEAYQRFEPDDPVQKHGWLFSDQGTIWKFEGEDWEDRFRALTQARQDAIQDVYEHGGSPLLLSMAANVERPDELGRALGQSGLLTAEEVTFLQLELAALDHIRAQFTRGYVVGRFRAQGWDWAEALLGGEAAAWSPAQRVEFLAGLPSMSRTWDWAERFGAETEREFWGRFHPFGLSDPTDYTRAAMKLLEYVRPHTAVNLLGLYADRAEVEPPSELIAEALEHAGQMAPPANLDWNMFAHNVAELLDRLEATDAIEESRLAALEWAYLPLLRHSKRPVKLLYRELARDPLFFTEVVSWAYRAEDDESPELTEEERTRASLGHQLLDTWQEVPGRQEDGSIDSGVLSTWITQAREALTNCGRGTVGDHFIGKVLRYGPQESDGTWPDKAIRDIIEAIGSEDLERGFEIEVFNSRGVVVRGLTDGGRQEQQLAERCRSYAQAVADRWPRTAAMLRRIADSYQADARREDVEAELREDLWR